MRTVNPSQEFSEQQAAEFLGISVDALYRLLDLHIFNNGAPRPRGLLFTHSDLLLIEFWSDQGAEKVVAMPRRG